MIRFFRQNLLDGYDAAWWWQMEVPQATKKDWDQIKKAFREKFGQTGEAGGGYDFAITQMIMSLSQREGQSIQAYVREAEQLPKRIPSSKDSMLAAAVIRGLFDGTRRHEVSFATRGKKTGFSEAVDLIKAAHRSFGDLGTLRPGRIVRISTTPLRSTPRPHRLCRSPPPR